jgi:hypothetical protein
VSRFHGETWFVDEDGCRLALVRQGQAGPRRSFREDIRRYQKRNRLDVLQHTQFPVRMFVLRQHARKNQGQASTSCRTREGKAYSAQLLYSAFCMPSSFIGSAVERLTTAAWRHGRHFEGKRASVLAWVWTSSPTSQGGAVIPQ